MSTFRLVEISNESALAYELCNTAGGMVVGRHGTALVARHVQRLPMANNLAVESTRE